MSLLAILPPLCFIISYIATKKWLLLCKDRGLVSRDIHKRDERLVPSIGGLPAALISTFAPFVMGFGRVLDEIIALISLTAILQGLLDDTISLRDSEKVLIPAISFIPLGLYLGRISILGLSIGGPLALAFVVLLGTFSANSTNTFAGFNGLEAGLSVITGSFLSMTAYLREDDLAFLLLASFSASYLAFLIFNFYPARTFPGNCSTFQMGAFLASISVSFGLTTPFLILMVPHGVDFLLKLLSWRKMKEKKPTKMDEKGFLVPPPHLSLVSVLLRLKKMREWELVLCIYLFEVLLGLIALLITFVYLPR